MAKKKKTGDFKPFTTKGMGELEAGVKEYIHRRRRQMLIHSFIYYRLNDNLVSDNIWQKWANQLRKIQEKYPQWKKIGFYDDAFSDWNGDSGAFLPLGDPWIYIKAMKLLKRYG